MKLKASQIVLNGDAESLNYKASREEHELKTIQDEFKK